MAADKDIYTVLLDQSKSIGALTTAIENQSERLDTVVTEIRKECKEDVKELDQKLVLLDTKVGRVTIAVVALLVTVFGAEKLVSMFMR